MGALRPVHHRLSKALSVVAVSLLTATLLAGPSAGDDPDDFDYGSNDQSDGVDLSGTDDSPGGDGSGSDGSDGSGDTGGGVDPVGSSEPQPWYERKYVPNCSVNGPDGGADALCQAAVSTCPEEGDIRYREYQRLVAVDGSRGPWEALGTVCRGADDPVGVVQPEITPEMVVDAAESLAPESTFSVEPETTTYVNLPTNFVADRQGATETVFLFGQAIEVRFAPTDHDWDFGDGGSGTGRGIAGAEIGQAGAVEYEYRRADGYDVTLTRTFTVSFTLPDGEQVSIPGEISTTSAPYGLEVGEIQSTVTGVD